MRTYNELAELFKRCRNKNKGYRLSGRMGSTRLVTASVGFKYEDLAICLHGTDVVTISIRNRNKRETFKLCNGGWYSKVTAERIGQYSPVRITSCFDSWYVVNSRGRVFEYQNGIVFDKAGNCKTKGIKSWTSKEFYGKRNADGKLLKRGEYQRLSNERAKQRREFKAKRLAANQPMQCGLYNPPALQLVHSK